MAYEWLEIVEDLPENCHYADEGCEQYYSCLNCPFPSCILDLAPGEQYLIKDWRDDEIIRQLISGTLIQDISFCFHIDRATTYRILNKYKKKAISSLRVDK